MNYSLFGPNLLLPWYSTEEEDKTFKKCLKRFAIAFLIFSLLVWVYPVPEKTREQKETLPSELARVILEKKELPPPPKLKPKPKKPEPKPKLKKPEPQKPEPKKPESKLEPKKPEPKKLAPRPIPTVKSKPAPKKAISEKTRATQQQKIEQAKQQAASKITQFQDALADMRDLAVNTAENNNLAIGASKAKKLDRAIITSRSKTASGGINTAKLSRDTGGQTLSGRKTTAINSSLANKQRAADANRKKATGADGRQIVSRSEEAIRKVIDRNKAAIDIIYQKALRKSPELEGRFVVKIVIESGGKVSSVTIVSSELNDTALEKKLLTRIGFINFGKERVARTTVNFTFDFFPQ